MPELKIAENGKQARIVSGFKIILVPVFQNVAVYVSKLGLRVGRSMIGIRFPVTAKYFFFSTVSRLTLETTQSPLQ